MKFTANARARIVRNGGQCLTLDQYVMLGHQFDKSGTVLLRGKVNGIKNK